MLSVVSSWLAKSLCGPEIVLLTYFTSRPATGIENGDDVFARVREVTGTRRSGLNHHDYRKRQFDRVHWNAFEAKLRQIAISAGRQRGVREHVGGPYDPSSETACKG